MFVDVMLRRRASLDEPIPALNAKIVEQLVSVPNFWGVGKSASDASNDYDGEGAALDLRKALRPGLSGQGLYVPRFAGFLSRDIAQSDDYLRLRLNTEKINYAEFCSTTLPQLIEIFRPYRVAAETDEVVRRSDNAAVRLQWQANGPDINGRDSTFRIWPVCFFDDLLCRRAFGIGASEVVARAEPECERAEVLHGGAFLLVTEEIVVGMELDTLNARIKERLDTRHIALKGAA